MGSGYKQPKDIIKALKKGRDERREQRIQDRKDIAAMSNAERLSLEISELKSRIKLVESDLSGQFKGNQIIVNKLNLLKQQFAAKEKELENEKQNTQNTTTENSN